MTALAELWRSADQELGMIAAVWRMAIQTIFLHRRMLKHERPPLLRMAFVAQFIYRIGFDLFVTEGAMGIVTTRTFNQPLFNRMMRLPARL